jgi:lysyl-tRNA synthetase class I
MNNTNNNNTTPKILGSTDSVCTCEKCGKTGLKKTIALDFDGDIRYFGVDCAAAACMGKKSRSNAKHVDLVAKSVEYATKWLAIHKNNEQVAKNIANKIRVWGVCASIVAGGLLIDNKTFVKF